MSFNFFVNYPKLSGNNYANYLFKRLKNMQHTKRKPIALTLPYLPTTIHANDKVNNDFPIKARKFPPCHIDSFPSKQLHN